MYQDNNNFFSARNETSKDEFGDCDYRTHNPISSANNWRENALAFIQKESNKRERSPDKELVDDNPLYTRRSPKLKDQTSNEQLQSVIQQNLQHSNLPMFYTRLVECDSRPESWQKNSESKPDRRIDTKPYNRAEARPRSRFEANPRSEFNPINGNALNPINRNEPNSESEPIPSCSREPELDQEWIKDFNEQTILVKTTKAAMKIRAAIAQKNIPGIARMRKEQNVEVNSNKWQVEPQIKIAQKVIPTMSQNNSLSASSHLDVDRNCLVGNNLLPFAVRPQATQIVSLKETITLESCVLYPPHPGVFETSQKNPGCKTVFVRGFNDSITKDIIREIFSIGRCGEIKSLRLNKDDTCFIQFVDEASADKAIMLSGYFLKMADKGKMNYVGRIHVDYANTKADEYDWECLKRAEQRKARHAKQRTPPPVVPFSEYEASRLINKLKNEKQFKHAVKVLQTWLEKGFIDRRSSVTFHSMLQCVHSRMKKISNENKKVQQKIGEVQVKMLGKMSEFSGCFQEILKLLETVLNAPVILQNFTKAQRKEFELMKQKTSDVIEIHSRDLVAERVEDEMELSDGEGGSEKPVDGNKKVTREDIFKIQEKLEEVRKRFQTVKNKNIVLKNKMGSNVSSNTRVLQDLQEKISAKQLELSELQKFKEDFLATQSLTSDVVQSQEVGSSSAQESNRTLIISQQDMFLITFIATFLLVYPFGASIDDIYTYLIMVDPSVYNMDIEGVLLRFHNLFKKILVDSGATATEHWKFLGFNIKSL